MQDTNRVINISESNRYKTEWVTNTKYTTECFSVNWNGNCVMSAHSYVMYYLYGDLLQRSSI